MSIFIDESELLFQFEEQFEVVEYKKKSKISECYEGLQHGIDRGVLVSLFGEELVEGVESGLIENFDDKYLDDTYERALGWADEYANKISAFNNKPRDIEIFFGLYK